MAKTCPKCGVVNSDSARTCECGANLSRVMVDAPERRLSTSYKALLGIVALGVFIYFFLPDDDSTSGFVQPSSEERSVDKGSSTAKRRIERERDRKPRTPDRAWYDGGTLHGATVADWRAANYRNRLATSADFAATALNRKGVKLSSMSELRPKAQALEICVSEAAKPPIPGTMRIAELAAQCAILMDSQ